MESSPWVRLAMAAGFYLLVIWGHLSLADGILFAVFYAFAMAAMLVYWSTQRAVESDHSQSLLAVIDHYHDFEEYSTDDWQQMFDAEQIIDGVQPKHAWDESITTSSTDKVQPGDRESLRSALTRLDAIKAELKAQYAQLGKDQTAWRSGDRWRFDGL